jgi:hypothetical protein
VRRGSLNICEKDGGEPIYDGGVKARNDCRQSVRHSNRRRILPPIGGVRAPFFRGWGLTNVLVDAVDQSVHTAGAVASVVAAITTFSSTVSQPLTLLPTCRNFVRKKHKSGRARMSAAVKICGRIFKGFLNGLKWLYFCEAHYSHKRPNISRQLIRGYGAKIQFCQGMV